MLKDIVKEISQNYQEISLTTIDLTETMSTMAWHLSNCYKKVKHKTKPCLLKPPVLLFVPENIPS